ncbi:MAG: transposase [Candidatus Cryosericum sp.]
MGRTPRIEYEGAVYHVTNRGNGQEMIYREEADWKAFLGIMSDVVSEFGWRIYTYCLMGNHYHLLLQTPQPNLSLGMRELDLQYTLRYNWRYEHSGHVFQDRYWSGLVLNDNYLIDAASYLLLNPVRAKLVHSPEEWRWSSCAAMAGLVPLPSWLDMDWLPVDFRGAAGDPNGPFLSYVRECTGKPRPANLEKQRRRTHPNVKTLVPGTTGIHN